MTITTPAQTRPAESPVALSSPTLLLLGRGVDRDSERGVECPGALPLPSDPSLVERAIKARETLGDKARSSSATTTSATRSSSSPTSPATASSSPATPPTGRSAEYIVFCGVHFMAESADILTDDASAGDPARPGGRVLDGGHGGHQPGARRLGRLEDAGLAAGTIPVTYMNSSADIKAFIGAHGGTICTSSNAKTAMQWSFERGEQGPVPSRPAPGAEHRRPRARPVPPPTGRLRPASP